MCRLRVLRLVVSHTFLYKKLDEFGHYHNAKIMEKVKNESATLLSMWNNDYAINDHADEVAAIVSHQADQGRKIVFDNFDFNQKVNIDKNLGSAYVH